MKIRSWSIYLLFIWLFFFGILPLFLIIITSFLSRDPQHFVSFPFTFSNYMHLFSWIFAKIFIRSFLIAALTTFICLILAYPFSYLLIKAKHQSLLLLLIIIPFWTSSLVRTYSLIALLKAQGIINSILLHLHWIQTPIPLLYTNFAVITGLIYNLFPFMVLPIFTNMERFDFRLIEAAKDLGANKLAIFFKVFLPNTATGIIAGSLMVSLPAMTLFYIPNVLGGARSVLLGNLIQDEFLVLGNWPEGAASSVILTVLLLVFLLILRRENKDHLH